MDPDTSMTDLAIATAARITLRASIETVDDDLDGWLLGSIQEWWLLHRHQIGGPGVLMAFCDAVEAALPHLNRSPKTESLSRTLIEAAREAGERAYATARGLLVVLGLDPDPTLLSLLLEEWSFLAASLAGEESGAAATHLARLVRRSLTLIADPLSRDEDRAEIVAAATLGLGATAAVRGDLDDPWRVLADVNTFCGADPDSALVARLAISIDILDAIAGH